MKMLPIIPNGRLRTLMTILLVLALLFANFTVLSHALDNSLSTNVISAASALDSASILLASMGVISSDSSGNYNLNKTLTRAEFAKMLVMASSYKDLVATASYSSPFKDVSAKNWAAPYIRIAVSNGLLSGYSDGTFRPNNPVTLEQGVNSVLKLLGYDQSDFKGAFPYAQMNIYSSNGLSDNITGGIGTLMTKNDVANLIYNTMGTDVKDGTQKYAETLGYSLNESGEVDYAGVISSNMNGPYTVKSSSWASDLGMNTSGLIIYKNGSIVSSSDVKPYDILYYSQNKNTVWVYDDKVTGIYQSASPSQNAVTSVMVSGTEYQLESTAAFTALSSTGTLKIGNAVTLLLGKNGGVVDAVSSTVMNEPVALYVTETGTKTFRNSDGSEYTADYIKGVKPNGTEIEYAVDESWIDVGDMIKISFDDDGEMDVTSASGGNVSGLADADLNKIGTFSISANAVIMDTSLGNYTLTSMSRLDGVKLTSDDVLYYEAGGGLVTSLVLDDVTGDTAKYGVVTSSKSKDSSMSLSGSYTYLIDGVESTLSTQGSALHASVGPAKFYGESGKISGIKRLIETGKTIKSFNGSQVVVNDDIGIYPVSADAAAFTYTSGGGYKASTMSAALSAYQSGKTVTFYYDKEPSEGGQIRVIVY